MKKKHIGLKIFLAIVLILLIAAGVFFIPRIIDAGKLEQKVSLNEFSFDLEVTLDKNYLSSNALKSTEALSEMTGISSEAMYQLHLIGQVKNGVLYTEVYPKGESEPLSEFYLSDGQDIVNGAMIYEKIRTNTVGDNVLLELLVPKWNDSEYMTTEQLGKMLETNLGGTLNISMAFTKMRFTKGQYLLPLLAMKKSSGVYSFNYEGADVALSVPTKTTSDVTVQISCDSLGQTVVAANEKLAKLSIKLPEDNLKVFKAIEGTVTFHELAEKKLPTQLISDSTVETLSSLRALLRSISGKN